MMNPARLSRRLAVVMPFLLVAACHGNKGSVTAPGPAPMLVDVSPHTGTVGTLLTITGSNFRPGAQVLVGGSTADSVDVTSDARLYAYVPSGIAAGDTVAVTVRNSDGTKATLPGTFTAVAPQLDFVNGATLPSGKVGSTVVLDGSAFGDLQGVGSVLFSDGAGGTLQASIGSPDDWTDTFILTTVPSGAATGPIVVQTATGTSDSIAFTITQAATFSPSVVNWVQTTSLPDAVSGQSALAVPLEDASGTTLQLVYVIGGAGDDSTPQTGVHFAHIQAGGTLDSWTATTPLPEARAFEASVAATPFNSRVKNGNGWLFVMGGTTTRNGEPVNTVLQAPLNADGTVGAWTSAVALPQALQSLRAVVFESEIYIIGGSTSGDLATTAAYRAAIDTTGQLGPWQMLAPLPSPRSYHQLGLIGNCLFVLGGDSATVSPEEPTLTSTRYSDIIRARIDLRTDDLTAAGWVTDATQPIKAREKHVSLMAGGGILQNAGIYNGIGAQGASENTFAQVSADCSVGSFSGANNQASIKKNGGVNLFNQAGISFIDAAGVAHVMILGGDDVDNPGMKQTGVWVF